MNTARRLLPMALSLAGALAPAASAASASDHPAAACADEADGTARLACYDRAFRRAPAASAARAASAPVAGGDVVAAPPPSAPGGVVGAAPTVRGSAGESPLSRLWELAPADKRGTFSVRSHRANYLLPVHYRSSSRAPSSPTHPVPTEVDDRRRLEAKFQISLRAKAFEDVGLPGADVWLAYSQISIWQLYNPEASSPFRSSDFQPEAIYVVPVGRGGEGLRLPAGWRWRMVQAGIAHQSNGQGGALSRSWNRVWLGAGVERDTLGLQLRVHRRVRFASQDDNPDLVRYIGHGELVASYVTDGTAAALTWRTGSGFVRRGSLQLDWSHPVRRSQPEGLRWYVQVFSGYGETLLDYNHRQTSVGAGLALFQF